MYKHLFILFFIFLKEIWRCARKWIFEGKIFYFNSLTHSLICVCVLACLLKMKLRKLQIYARLRLLEQPAIKLNEQWSSLLSFLLASVMFILFISLHIFFIIDARSIHSTRIFFLLHHLHRLKRSKWIW